MITSDRLKALWHSFRYCRVPKNTAGIDKITRILAASRLCVIPMTIYSVTIGALLALNTTGKINYTLYLLILTGFTLSHLLDNLVNDYYDFKRKIDNPGYFRALYGPHPFIDSILTTRDLKLVVLTVGLYDALLTTYLALTTSMWIGILALIGALVILTYAGIGFDVKRTGLGEILVAVVWGPVMIGGTILALTGGEHPVHLLYIYTPYSLAVTLVLIGKHMDKYPHDKEKNINTLPVKLGPGKTRVLSVALALTLPPASFIILYHYLQQPATAITLLTLLTVYPAVKILAKPKPEEPPEKWTVWPLWYVAASYAVMDSLGRTTITALLATAIYGSHPVITSIILAIEAMWETIVAYSLNKTIV